MFFPLCLCAGSVGTWIPVERGVSLAQQYGVLEALQPIIDYVPTGTSPPPAPKHITAAPKGPRAKRTNTPAGVAPVNSSSAGMHHPPPSSAGLPPQISHMPPPPAPTTRPSRAARNEHPVYVTPQLSKVEQAEEQEVSPGPSEATSASRTPSPLESEEYGGSQLRSQTGLYVQPTGPLQRKRKHDATGDELLLDLGGGGRASQGGPALYARMILDYFVSESAQIPAFLISPPADFDPNVVIDDDGHTALHWACAMGRIRIVKLLLTAGADIFRANAMGQTALMRSVMFTNNYDLRKFPELFELLHRSTINIDRNDRTVFHYVIDIALQKGKAHAAKYYLEVILERLKEYPREVADILNFQDEEGETALTLAARARSKNLVRILLNHGADARITNRDGKSAEDYILEDERFRSADQGQGSGQQLEATSGGAAGSGALALHDPASMGMPMQNVQQAGGFYSQNSQQPQDLSLQGFQAVPAAFPSNGYYTSSAQPSPQYQLAGLAQAPFPTHLHYSETGQRITSHVIPQVHEQLEALASAFDSELEDKEKDIAQAHALLANIQAEVVESQKLSSSLKSQADSTEELKMREDSLQEELKDKMGKRFRLGWEKYVRDEEERQKAFVSILKTENEGFPQHSISFINRLNGAGYNNNSGSPADLQSIFAPPVPPATIASATKAAQEQLGKLKTTRMELFETYVNLQSEAGTGERVNDYRKLIALGCGIQPQEVDDDLIGSLLESLDNGDEQQLQTVPVQVQ